MTEKITRRTVLLGGLQIPVGGALLWGLSGCGGGGEGSSGTAGAAVCADPSAMTDAEQSIRRGVNYTESSANPQQVCAGCAFFHAGSGACGTCDMFSGGPVNSGGHCNSWSAKS